MVGRAEEHHQTQVLAGVVEKVPRRLHVGFACCSWRVCVYSNASVPPLESQLRWQLLPEFHRKIFGKSHADMFILLAVRMSKCAH